MSKEVNEILSQQTVPTSLAKKPIEKTTILVTIFCWIAIFVEGYDLVVYGVVLPVLMDPNVWGISPAQAGAMGSYALLGMFLGSTIGGFLSDKYGRKIVLIASLIMLSIMMGLTAMAGSPELFGVYRFIAGLGISGVVPAASALTSEYSPPKYRSFFYVIMYTGFAFGGVAASLLGILLIEPFGWRSLFWLGVLPIFLIPVLIKYLPESYAFFMANNKEEKAKALVQKYKIHERLLAIEKVEKRTEQKSNIFSKHYLLSTVLFSLIYIGAFLLIYGINTWLPQIMKEAGYPVNSSILFLLIFNFSAIIGGIIAGWFADQLAPKKVISFTYLLAAISIALLSIKFNMVILYILIGIAGFGTTGTTFVLASYVMKQYDSQNRATAIGFVSAVGRIGAVVGPIIVGMIMSIGAGFAVNFYLFAVVALVAAILILFMPRIKQS